MKSQIFTVPADSIVGFADIITDNKLRGVIIGVKDNNLEILVYYEPENIEAFHDLTEYVGNISGNTGEKDNNQHIYYKGR